MTAWLIKLIWKLTHIEIFEIVPGYKYYFGSISICGLFYIIILTIVITIMLYLDEIIKYIFMQNYLISVMNSKICRRVGCDIIQFVNHTRMYTLKFIQNIIYLIYFISNMTHVQFLSHSSQYLSSLQIQFPFQYFRHQHYQYIGRYFRK